MSKPMHNKEESAALLKEIMTVPAMTAEQHAIILRRRIGSRRVVEDARERAQHLRDNAYPFS